MWFFPTKKEIKKEFKKIVDSFKTRDKEISQKANKRDLEKLEKETNSNSLKIARLEGVISMLVNQKSQSQSHKVSHNLKQSQGKIETKLINRVRRSKKALVMAEISKLTPSMSVIEIFDVIVKEKGLCSKASFYRYVSSLKSQKVLETETNLRLK